MPSRELVKYFREGMNQGVSLVDLKANLLDSGWSDWEIQKALNVATKRSGSVFRRLTPGNFLLIFVIFFMIVGLILIFAFNQNEIVLEESELERGVGLEMMRKPVKIQTENYEMSIVLEKSFSEHAEIKVDDASYDVDLNQTLNFDLDKDGNYDLSITLESIRAKIPKFYFEKIVNETDSVEVQEESCVESWTCGIYSECVNGTQSRNCVDVNNCGTEVSKPSLIKDCVSNESFVSKEEACSLENKTYFNSSYDCSSFSNIDYGGSTIKCCDFEPLLKFVRSVEFNQSWDSMNADEYCDSNFSEKIRSCELYKCIYVDPSDQNNYSIGVVLDDSNGCHIYSESIYDSYEYCRINSSFIGQFADYYATFNDSSYLGDENISVSFNLDDLSQNPINAKQIAYFNRDCQYIIS